MGMESVSIDTEAGKDKILGIEEYSDVVLLKYERSGQPWVFKVPREVIKFVKRCIDKMEVGEAYKSQYIYNKYIKEFKVESKEILNRMPIIEEELLKRISDTLTKEIVKNLRLNEEFILMRYDELIGQRKEDSPYFTAYAAIKYWASKDVIMHNKRGTIIRLL